MKNFLGLFILFLASSAHAELTIGSAREFKITSLDEPYTVYREVQVVTAINVTTDEYTTEDSIYRGDTRIAYDGQVFQKISDNTNDESIFDSCLHQPSNLNPQLETITVPAGKFLTCHLSQKHSGESLDRWYSKVVFGLVKMTRDGAPSRSNFTWELASYRQK